MISHIRGTLCGVTQTSVVVEAGGIGYEILVPQSVLERLPRIDSELKLHTYLQVKEDGVALFGFDSEDDLSVFKLLITVSGIGPKGAIGILSAMSADDLRFAVLADDAKTIAKSPGIGIKTAGKLILELKDKLKLSDAFEKKLEHSQAGETQAAYVAGNNQNEAIMALTALGYSAAEAAKAVRAVTDADEMSVEELLSQALKHI